MQPPSRKETVFADALARPVAERRAFLDGACGSDAAHRARAEALLAAAAGRLTRYEREVLLADIERQLTALSTSDVRQ